MANSLETDEARNKIVSSLIEVFEGLDRMANSFIAAKRNDALWTGVLGGGLVLIFLGILGLPLIDNAYHEYLYENPVIFIFSELLVVIISLLTGFLTYILARGMKKTQLQMSVGLNYQTFLKYLKWLEQHSLVKIITDNDGNERIVLSEKGMDAHKRLVEWIKETMKNLKF